MVDNTSLQSDPSGPAHRACTLMPWRCAASVASAAIRGAGFATRAIDNAAALGLAPEPPAEGQVDGADRTDPPGQPASPLALQLAIDFGLRPLLALIQRS